LDRTTSRTLFFFSSAGLHRDLPSFPTRRSSDLPDIWAEGVRFPALKLVEKGTKRRDVEYMMAANSRTPTFLGDLRAQVGATELRSEEHTSELQSLAYLVCRLLLEKKKRTNTQED